MSLLLHALLLLLLAFIIHLRHESEQRRRRRSTAIVDTQLGELTSLTEAKRSGDPFTLEDSTTRRRSGSSRSIRRSSWSASRRSRR